MDCSEFRDHHCTFVDDTLAGVELVRMQRHIAECPSCAAMDARVRRSLMVARSLPPIEPSADFGRKLEARLQACRVQKQKYDQTAYANFRIVAIVGAVASALMLGYVGESLHLAGLNATQVAAGRDIVLPPVVAMAVSPTEHSMSEATPEMVGQRGQTSATLTSDIGSQPEIVGVAARMAPAEGSPGDAPAPAIIASMAAGLPLWPAALFAEQAPMHYASYRKTVH